MGKGSGLSCDQLDHPISTLGAPVNLRCRNHPNRGTRDYKNRSRLPIESYRAPSRSHSLPSLRV